MDEKIVKDSQGLAKELVNDCISRQAAIDALGEDALWDSDDEYETGMHTQWSMDVDAIKALPSVQPDYKDGWIYTGKKAWEFEPCEDTISRQMAIDALRTHERKASKKWFDNQLDIEWNNAIDICCYDIEDLPSAQSERKRGTWIIKDNPGTVWYRVTCSECGEDVTSTAPCIGFYPNAKVTWDYCPNCGADMREVDE